jgi:N-acetylmuramoyl-L-alanine amidase
VRSRRRGLSVVGLCLLTACSAAPTTLPTSLPGATTTVTPARPVVVLDPGHNGGNATHPAETARLVPDGRGGTKPCNTTGTETDAGYPEHAFAFDVAQRVRAELEAAGVSVVLTRPDDDGVGPCVDERGTAGQRAGAAAVVSIHADGAPPGGRGFHVALSDPPLQPAQEGPAHGLATALRDALRAAGFPDSTYLGRAGIVPRPDLAGLNLATRPAVLVECANMRNPAEAAVVSSPAGRQRYADAIARGTLAFLGR